MGDRDFYLASLIPDLRLSRGRAEEAHKWQGESPRTLQPSTDLDWEGEAQTI